MSTRITQRDLEAVCARINRTVNGSESEPYERVRLPLSVDVASRTPKDDPERFAFRQVPNVYSISYAYGGAALHRNCSVNGDGESHGVSDVFGYHMPKRELYERMQAFLRGIETVA